MTAYAYPLLIKHLLVTPIAHASRCEIVYRDRMRYGYRTLKQRIGRLGSALTSLGVEPGDTVAVMDWDSHRYLEAFFAIPMLGAVLQTVNVRLSPEQIIYTINHAGPSILLVNDEFTGLVESIRPQLTKVKTLVVMSDRPSPATGNLDFAGEYEGLLAAAPPDYDFPDFDENTLATTFYTTGTTGAPKGVYFSHRQLVLHALAELAFLGIAGQQGRFSRDDVYMPITPMFHVHAWGFPWAATLAGVKQVYPGRYEPAGSELLVIRVVDNYDPGRAEPAGRNHHLGRAVTRHRRPRQGRLARCGYASREWSSKTAISCYSTRTPTPAGRGACPVAR